ncbi:hypothetical protein GZL_08988 [Streptomyces sp. 769]|nr:hypothetical protein GZL_08988 [Streptomyces sp. 769]
MGRRGPAGTGRRERLPYGLAAALTCYKKLAKLAT